MFLNVEMYINLTILGHNIRIRNLNNYKIMMLEFNYFQLFESHLLIFSLKIVRPILIAVFHNIFKKLHEKLYKTIQQKIFNISAWKNNKFKEVRCD